MRSLLKFLLLVPLTWTYTAHATGIPLDFSLNHVALVLSGEAQQAFFTLQDGRTPDMVEGVVGDYTLIYLNIPVDYKDVATSYLSASDKLVYGASTDLGTFLSRVVFFVDGVFVGPISSPGVTIPGFDARTDGPWSGDPNSPSFGPGGGYFYDYVTITPSPSPVPEPPSAVLLGTSILGIGYAASQLRGRRRQDCVDRC